MISRSVRAGAQVARAPEGAALKVYWSLSNHALFCQIFCPLRNPGILIEECEPKMKMGFSKGKAI